MDKAVFNDPDGVTIGDGESDYRYEGKNCIDDTCDGYSLRANLENEADFVKENRQ